MRARKFTGMAVVAAMVGALLTVLSPTAAQAAAGSRLQNLGGKSLNKTSAGYLIATDGSPLRFSMVDAGSVYETFWEPDLNKNIGLSGNSTASGTQGILANGSSNNTQDWQRVFQSEQSGWFQMKNRANLSRCLGISGGASGYVVAVFNCAPADAVPNNQLWAFVNN
jgi:hypothetical protein